jgi:acyl carrier protein
LKQSAKRRAPRPTTASVAVTAKVRKALRRVLPHLPLQALTPKARLLADLELDSLRVAELSLALEDELGYPVFLAELFANVDDPDELRLADLLAFVARNR